LPAIQVGQLERRRLVANLWTSNVVGRMRRSVAVAVRRLEHGQEVEFASGGGSDERSNAVNSRSQAAANGAIRAYKAWY
jgi:hypothetical protein